MPPAEAQDFSGYEHDLATQDVIGGHAVFQAVNPSGIFRHVAADRAGNLRGRVRRVIKSGIRNGVADRQVRYTRLTTATRFSKSISRI